MTDVGENVHTGAENVNVVVELFTQTMTKTLIINLILLVKIIGCITIGMMMMI